MYQVFVSHKTEELYLLEGLFRALNQVGIGVYIAERAPWPGVYLYDQKIIPAIASSDSVLVLVTSASAASPDVNQEIGIARSHSKPIVALVERGIQVKGVLVGREVVVFDRQNPLPALQAAFDHVRSQAASKEKAEAEGRRNAALAIGFLALLFILGGSGGTQNRKT